MPTSKDKFFWLVMNEPGDVEFQHAELKNEQPANKGTREFAAPHERAAVAYSQSSGVGGLYRVLGILWMAVCGVSGVKCLWVLLYHASSFAKAFYYSVAWGFCLLYLTGAVAGFLLFRAANWARMLTGWISVLIVLATIVALSAFGDLPTLYYIVGVLAAASLALMYVSAIIKLAA